VTHKAAYLDLFMVAIVGALVALCSVIALGSAFGSF
jgi:CHASE3 domain sensor protein